MKKVLFLTTRLIYPVNDGRKVVLYNYCKGLVEQHNCEVRLFAILDEKDKRVEQPKFISKTYYGDTPKNFEKVKNLLGKSFIKKDWPLQVSIYYSKKCKEYLYKVIEEYKPDIVICDMARTAEYMKNLDDNKYIKVLDMDDIISKRYFRQIYNGNLSVDSMGAYSKKMSPMLLKIAKVDSIMKYIMKKEANLLQKYEQEVAKYYKHIIFVSPLERKEFNEKCGNNKAIDITIGVDVDYFNQNIAEVKLKKHIVFLGNMYVAHNKDAVRGFIKEVLPVIRQKVNGVTFRIVGRCPDDFKEEMKQYDGIEVTGEVDDIRKYVQECQVAVAPLKYGSGIKTKILETMAMGIPVVTNKIGIEGLQIEDDYNIMVADKADVFAEKVIKCLEDDEYCSKISNNAKQFIKANHVWKDILKKFELIIN